MAHRGYTGQGGPNNRPQRYTEKLTIYLSKDAMQTLGLMGQKQNRKIATLGRMSVMKDIYIFKAEQKRHQEIEEGLKDE
jgi:hypothetical protein